MAAIPLGAPLLTRSSFLPANETGAPSCIRRCASAYLELLRVEVTVPVCVAAAAVRSYRTVSPLPDPGLRRAIGGLLSVALFRVSPRMAVSHHPALLESGLSSPFAANRESRDCLACFASGILAPYSGTRSARRPCRGGGLRESAHRRCAAPRGRAEASVVRHAARARTSGARHSARARRPRRNTCGSS